MILPPAHAAAATRVGLSEREADAILMNALGAIASPKGRKSRTPSDPRHVAIDGRIHRRLKLYAKAQKITPYAALQRAVGAFLDGEGAA